MTSARLPQNPADHTGLRGGTRTSLLVGAVALAVRLTIVLAIPVRDVGDMAGWMEAARRVSLEGIGAAYEALDPASLYPPGFMYPLWVTGQVYLRCCSSEFELQTRSLGVLMRLAPILADSGLAVLVGQLAALAWGPGRRLPAGLLYALNPAV